MLSVHGLVCDRGHAVCVLLPPLDVQTEDGWTAATWAVDYGQTDCLTALIEGKADLDIKVRGSDDPWPCSTSS